MKINKKLSTAIVLSLMLGVYGSASAADHYLYGIDGAPGVFKVDDFAGITNLEITTTAGQVVAASLYDSTHAQNSNTSRHIFTVDKGTWEYVSGGYSKRGENKNGNIVTVGTDDGDPIVKQHVDGGRTGFNSTEDYGDAIKNQVILKAGQVGGITGGSASFGGNAKQNTVIIEGGIVKKDNGNSRVNGGWAGNSSKSIAEANEVHILGGEIFAKVYGGYADAASKDNIVEVTNDVRVTEDVIGGYSFSGTVTGNHVSITNVANIEKEVYGGYTITGTAGGEDATDGNTVSINGASATAKVQIGTIEGGKYKPDTGNVYGGKSDNGAANNNKVGTSATNAATNFTANKIYGGQGTTSATGNKVWLGEGAIVNEVYGGDGKNGAEGNQVSITQTSTANPTQINGSVYGNYSDSGAAIGGVDTAGNPITNVSISDGSVRGTVYGGYGKTGAEDNKVSITGGHVNLDVFGGFASNYTAEDNTVSINGTSDNKVQIGNNVYGGRGFRDEAIGNKVGTADNLATNFSANGVYGGWGYTGVESNEVWLGEGCNITDSVYGGKVGQGGTASGNKVSIEGTTTKITKNVYGNYTENGNVYGAVDTDGNPIAPTEANVSITGGSVNGSVYGGSTSNGTATGNEVTITDGTIGTAGHSDTGNVYGGYVTTQGDAQSNKVTISSGNIYGEVYGGKSVNGTAGGYDEENKKSLGNKVTISGGTIGTSSQESKVIGGQGAAGASYNEVEMTATSSPIVYGNVIGGMADGNAENNVVTLNGGSILANGSANGGKSENGDATKNQVTVGATSVQTVNGGRADNGTASENVVTVEQWNHSGGNIRGGFGKIATQNEVYVKKGTVDAYVYGGLGGSEATKNYVKVETAVNSQNLFVYGGESSSGTVSQNVVDVYGKPNSVYGGYTTGSGAVSENVVNLYKDSNVNDVYGGKSDSGAVSGNIINVMGDVTVFYDVVGGESTSGAANDNIVNLGGYKDETGILYRELGAANVIGKLIGGIGTSKSGNTLNVYSLNNQVGGIEGFQKMNFFIPKDAAVGDILVKSTGDVDLSEAKDNIKAGFHNETSLTYGDKVKLIASDTKVSGMDGTSTLKVEETDFTDVDLLVYQGDDSMNQVSANATTLVAEIYNQELNENSKVLLETVMEEASLINDGSDMLAGAGLDSAQSAIAADLQNGAASGSMSIFGAVSGNKSKLKTGSHVDANGWNMNIGLAKELKNKDGKMILAPVVEYGRGEYDSYLDNGYHADGNAHFVGGGVMAKQINNNGNYFEGSLRAGKVSSEFKSAGGNYDSDAKYVAGHIGVGHIQKMDAKNSMDYYAKFFHTHISDDDVVVHAKGKDLALDLDSMNSSRLRIGGRLTHKMSNNNAYYFGLAYQREFNGNANGTLQDKDIVAPSMKGNTGFMELGVKLFDASKYDLDLGGFGSVGKKKGAGVNLNFNWKF